MFQEQIIFQAHDRPNGRETLLDWPGPRPGPRPPHRPPCRPRVRTYVRGAARLVIAAAGGGRDVLTKPDCDSRLFHSIL